MNNFVETEINSMNQKYILKSKDIIIKSISLCGIFYTVSLFLLIVLGIAFSQNKQNIDLKNSTIAFGVISIFIYLTQFILSLILLNGFVNLFDDIKWKKNSKVVTLAFGNAILVGFFCGFACYPLMFRLKRKTTDISNAYLTIKLNKNVETKNPYDDDQNESETNILNAESYNFEVPIDIINMTQESSFNDK